MQEFAEYGSCSLPGVNGAVSLHWLSMWLHRIIPFFSSKSPESYLSFQLIFKCIDYIV